MFIIGNKINELAIFIQCGIHIRQQRLTELRQRQLACCTFKHLESNAGFKIGQIFADIGLRHPQQGSGITNTVGGGDDGNNF